MRTPAGRFMQFFLCVMMLMAFSVQKASALTDWKNEWNWVNFNPADGTLDLYILSFSIGEETMQVIVDSVRQVVI